MTGWMEVEDAPQSSHNSIISTFTNISQGLGWCEERAINYLSASLDLETLCSAQDLRNVSLKPGHWHHSVVRRCHTPTFRSLVMLPSTQGGWREIKHYGMH